MQLAIAHFAQRSRIQAFLYGDEIAVPAPVLEDGQVSATRFGQFHLCKDFDASTLPQRNARRHETNRSFLLAQKGYQDGVNHNAGYAQRRAVPAWVSIAEKWVVY